MKIGLSIYSLKEAINKGMTAVEAIEWIAANGGEHMEVVSFVTDLVGKDEKIEELREASLRTGVALSAYCLPGDVLDISPSEYEAEIKRIKSHIDIAHQLGIKVVRHDLSSYTRTAAENIIENYDRDLPMIVRACQELADYAAQYGIITTVENHGRYINGGERVRRLMLAVDRPNFKCMLDIGNSLCVDEDPLVCVETLLPFAVAVHFKDFYVRNNKQLIGAGNWLETIHNNYLRGAIVGHGEIDVQRIMGCIKDYGYDGNVTIEFEGMEDCFVGSKIGMDNVRRLASGKAGAAPEAVQHL